MNIFHTLADSLRPMVVRTDKADNAKWDAIGSLHCFADDMEQCPEEFGPFNPSEFFADYCAQRASNASDASAREWWSRMAGNARKAATL